MVASFLEIAGPLNYIGAQIVYLCQPYLKQSIANYKIEAFAGILENPDQTQSFISSLREVEPR